MRFFATVWLLIFFLFLQNARAGEQRIIELYDGSTITGEVLSLSNGIYTVKSDSLGTVRIEEAKVRAIRAKQTTAPASSTTGTAAEVQSLQQKMQADQDIMRLVASLKDDPDFQKALEDPEIQKAVNTGDVAALIANPAFMKLLNNATVKDIEKKVE